MRTVYSENRKYREDSAAKSTRASSQGLRIRSVKMGSEEMSDR
jgi:hypothetical protein